LLFTFSVFVKANITFNFTGKPSSENQPSVL
jgi:hypothetical protein